MFGIIGCGNMGSAICKGIVEKGVFKPSGIVVYDKVKKKMKSLQETLSVNLASSEKEVVELSKYFILAVKPNQVKETLEAAKDAMEEGKILISICAGVKRGYIEKIVDKKVYVVRVMPNLPLTVGEGASVVCEIEDKDIKEFVKKIFLSLGDLYFLDEALMDAVTALSGSGPAYVFLLAESMIEAGIRVGIPRDIAKNLVKKTILGAAKLMILSEKDPSILRQEVTSPSGTTAEALYTLERYGFRASFLEAIYNATKRAKELGENF